MAFYSAHTLHYDPTFWFHTSKLLNRIWSAAQKVVYCNARTVCTLLNSNWDNGHILHAEYLIYRIIQSGSLVPTRPFRGRCMSPCRLDHIFTLFLGAGYFGPLGPTPFGWSLNLHHFRCSAADCPILCLFRHSRPPFPVTL